MHRPATKDDAIDGNAHAHTLTRAPQREASAINHVATFIQRAVWPGLGLLGESYLVFSMGTLPPLWDALYFQEEGDRRNQVLHTLSLSVVSGVIVGMLVVGYAADRIGRRAGSLITASTMVVGALGMTATAFCGQRYVESTDYDSTFLFHWLALASFVLGLGVGGEYPLSAASAAEQAMHGHGHSSRHAPPSNQTREPLVSNEGATIPPTRHASSATSRGRQVQLVFTMQGVGIFLHCALLTLLLTALASTGWLERNLNASLLWTWQALYTVGFMILLVVWGTRVLYLQESAAWTTAVTSSVAASIQTLDANRTIEGYRESGFDVGSRPMEVRRSTHKYVLLLQHYGVRLCAVSASWFLWDVAFYGNKLFQSAFLLSLTTGDANDASSLVRYAGAATGNAAVALAGYVAAACIMDHPRVGRRRLQQWGFVVTGLLFVGVGLCLDILPTFLLVSLYFASSFVGQLGPNATTFCIPAEIFPTELRTVCHGVAAASGKVGALVAALVFGSHASHNADRFLYSGYASLLAAMITYVFIPETVGLDLRNNDRHWHQVVSASSSQCDPTDPNSAPCHYRDDWDPTFLSVYERRQQRQRSHAMNKDVMPPDDGQCHVQGATYS